MRIKHKVTLEEGDALVVFPKEVWDYFVQTFNMLAEQYEEGSEEWSGWVEYADSVMVQAAATYNAFEEEEDW